MAGERRDGRERQGCSGGVARRRRGLYGVGGAEGAVCMQWAGQGSSTADRAGPGAWPVGRGVAMSGAWPRPQLTGRHFVGAGSPAPPGAVPVAGVARARPSARAAPPVPFRFPRHVSAPAPLLSPGSSGSSTAAAPPAGPGSSARRRPRRRHGAEDGEGQHRPYV